MTARLDTLPALPLATGALAAAVALEASTLISYIMLAALVAAGIFLMLKGGKTASGALAVGVSVTVASYFISSAPDMPRQYLDEPAEYTLYIGRTSNGAVAQRCTATAIARNGMPCPHFNSLLTVYDHPYLLREGDIVRISAAPERTGLYNGIPYMEMDVMQARANDASAAFAVSSDAITPAGRHSSIHTRAVALRERIAAYIHSCGLDAETASTLSAALLGAETPPETVKDRFRASGLSHLLCISGFHIAIIAWVISLLLFPLRLWTNAGRLRYLAVAGIVWIYVGILGMPPSATRAAIMLSAYCAARLLQRRMSPFNTLALAVALMLFLQPRWIFDVGFQLSVCAVMGLIVFADKFNPVPPRMHLARSAASLFAVPLAAMTGTAPVVLAWFHSIPLLSVPVNACAALIFPPFLILGAVVLLAGTFAAGIPGADIALKTMLEWVKNVCDLSDFNGSAATIFLTDTSLLLLTATILALGLWLHRRNRATALAAMCLAVLLGVSACTSARPTAGMAVISDERMTQVCLAVDGKGYIATSLPQSRSYHRMKAFFEGHGADSIVVGLTSGTLPFVLACSRTKVHQAEYLVIDRHFNGDIQSLFDSVRPHTVILGSHLDARLRRDALRAAEECRIIETEPRAYYTEMEANPRRK